MKIAHHYCTYLNFVWFIVDLYEKYGLFQRLTKIEAAYPEANVILHKVTDLPDVSESVRLSFFFSISFFLNSVVRPFQDYFSSYETGQSVGGRKRENPEKNHLAHPQAELGLSHMWPERGLNPHQTQR